MAKFAVLNGNQVTNIIVANTVEDAELVTNLQCIEYTEENPAGIGWTYNGSTFEQPLIEDSNE